MYYSTFLVKFSFSLWVEDMFYIILFGYYFNIPAFILIYWSCAVIPAIVIESPLYGRVYGYNVNSDIRLHTPVIVIACSAVFIVVFNAELIAVFTIVFSIYWVFCAVFFAVFN